MNFYVFSKVTWSYDDDDDDDDDDDAYDNLVMIILNLRFESSKIFFTLF